MFCLNQIVGPNVREVRDLGKLLTGWLKLEPKEREVREGGRESTF